tara:strand:- start:28 stop:267 length:240 start_codon:yes stop_codon:yes gene_type:complete
MFNFMISEDQRPNKHGWCKGGYFSKCKCCGGEFMGAKGSYNCANCAYDFDEQLEYERLWREVGWQGSIAWIFKGIMNNA